MIGEVRVSSLGLKFRISSKPARADGEIVTFTFEEWTWIKSQGLKPEEFKLLWQFKKEDYLHSIITEGQVRPETVADRYCREIVATLRPPVVESKKEESHEEKILPSPISPTVFGLDDGGDEQPSEGHEW